MTRRLVVLALLAAAALAPATLGSLSGADAPAASWLDARTISSGPLSASYPRSWHASSEDGNVVIWSGGAKPTLGGERTKKVPSGQTWIWLLSYGRIPTAGTPSRPATFELDDGARRFQSCGFGFDGWNVSFVEHGITVQAVVGIGQGARKADATRLLDRLVVSAV